MEKGHRLIKNKFFYKFWRAKEDLKKNIKDKGSNLDLEKHLKSLLKEEEELMVNKIFDMYYLNERIVVDYSR